MEKGQAGRGQGGDSEQPSTSGRGPYEQSTQPLASIDIESLRSRIFGTYQHTYTHRDLILYALGLGATVDKVRLQ